MLWGGLFENKMNSKQIHSILHSRLGDIFYGVFPSDEVPRTIDGFPRAFVINTDPSNKPGSHWLAVYIDSDGRADYFDSFGLSPRIPSITKLLNTCNDWQYNGTQIQGVFSSVCGHYCVHFLLKRHIGVPMTEIVGEFDTEDFEENDFRVTEWLNSNFDLSTEVYDTDFILNQICHALSTMP